jgi:PAS domain S-box-containing protein
LRDATDRADQIQSDAEGSLSELKRERDELRLSGEASEAARATLEKTVSELRQADDELTKQCALRSAEIDTLRKELEELRLSKRAAEEERDRLLGEHDAARTELDSLRKEAPELRGEKERLESELQSLASEKEGLESQLRSSSERLAAARKTGDVLREKCEEADARRSSEVEETLGRLRESETRLAERTAREEALTRKLKETEDRLRQAESTLSEKDELVRENSSRTEELDKREEDWRLKLADAAKRQSRLEATVADRERQLVEAQSKVEMLQKAVRSDDTKAPHETTALVSPPSGDATTWTESQRLQGAVERLEGELQQTRAEVEGIRSFYSVLIEGNIPAAILALDTELKVFAWNPAAEHLLGIRREYVLGRRLSDPELSGFPRELADCVKRVLAQSHEESIDRTWTLAGGEVCHVRGSCEPIQGEDGQALGVVVSLRDLSKDVGTSVDAKYHRVFANSLVRSIPMAFVVLDPQDRVVTWNRAAEQLLAVKESEATGNPFFSLKTPLAKKSFQQHLEKCKQDKATRRIRVRMDVQGETKSYVVTHSPFLGNAGKIRGSVLVVQPTSAG